MLLVYNKLIKYIRNNEENKIAYLVYCLFLFDFLNRTKIKVIKTKTTTGKPFIVFGITGNNENTINNTIKRVFSVFTNKSISLTFNF